jgi:BolA protein
MTIIDVMKDRLSTFSPESLEIIDESRLHEGHEGAKSGGGHFQLTIVSRQFDGKPLVARHRMIHAALSDLMHKQIHALSIQALTPEEI